MKKLYLTTALITGLLATSTAMAQDYDKKNTSSLEAQTGFSVLKPTTPIQDDQAQRAMDGHDNANLDMTPPAPMTVNMNNTDTIAVIEPIIPTVEINDKTAIIQEEEITIIEPASGMGVNSVIKTKKVIGNTDTGARPEDMAKTLNKLDQ